MKLSISGSSGARAGAGKNLEASFRLQQWFRKGRKVTPRTGPSDSLNESFMVCLLGSQRFRDLSMSVCMCVHKCVCTRVCMHVHGREDENEE